MKLQPLEPLSSIGPTAIEVFNKPGHLIRRLHQISTSIFIEEAKAHDLTPVQYASLIAVELLPGIDQTRLGRFLALDRQTVSNVVRRLEGKRLINRRRRNGRMSALYLTAAARAMIEAVRPRIAKVDAIILQPLTTRERETFMQLLWKLVDFNNARSRAPMTLAGRWDDLARKAAPARPPSRGRRAALG